ncbi:MAG: hypothetical protein DMG00_29320 [Acidobacteria bacterium]|nr:MAG: hypothetical protein DMG00_29320 [Acidobacteriota bacterium]
MPASPFTNRRPDDIVAEGGRVFPKGAHPSSGLPYEDVLKRTNQTEIEGEGYTEPGPERDKYAFQSFGAQFVEVRVDPEIAKVQISRVVSAFDVGKIVNAKTARSQGYSGVVMGVGMALMGLRFTRRQHHHEQPRRLCHPSERGHAFDRHLVRRQTGSVHRQRWIGRPRVGRNHSHGCGPGGCERRLSCDRPADSRPPDHARQTALDISKGDDRNG